MLVVHSRGIRLVCREESFDRLSYECQLGIVERALAEDRREVRGEEETVALAQRHLQPIGQMEEHLPARPCAPGLDEAQMTGRDCGARREVELADAAPSTPFAQHVADPVRCRPDPHRSRI